MNEFYIATKNSTRSAYHTDPNCGYISNANGYRSIPEDVLERMDLNLCPFCAED